MKVEKEAKINIVSKSFKRVKDKIRASTRANLPHPMEDIIVNLNMDLMGRMGYYALIESLRPLKALDVWIR